MLTNIHYYPLKVLELDSIGEIRFSSANLISKSD